MAKSKEKNRIKLYRDFECVLDVLTDKQAGQLIKGIFAYEIHCFAEFPSSVAEFAFDIYLKRKKSDSYNPVQLAVLENISKSRKKRFLEE